MPMTTAAISAWTMRMYQRNEFDRRGRRVDNVGSSMMKEGDTGSIPEIEKRMND
jgi:hypothetical protein